MHDTDQHKSCLVCGYDIAGTQGGSVCPECAFPVDDSRARRLHLSLPPSDLRRIVVALSTFLVWYVLVTARILVGRSIELRWIDPLPGRAVWLLLDVAGVICLGVGWILLAIGLSRPDPRWRSSLRRLTLVAGVLYVVSTFAVQALTVAWLVTERDVYVFVMQVAWGVAVVLSLFPMITTLLLLRDLSTANGHDRASAAFVRLFWVGPSLFVIWLAVLLLTGWFIGLIGWTMTSVIRVVVSFLVLTIVGVCFVRPIFWLSSRLRGPAHADPERQSFHK